MPTPPGAASTSQAAAAKPRFTKTLKRIAESVPSISKQGVLASITQLEKLYSEGVQIASDAKAAKTDDGTFPPSLHEKAGTNLRLFLLAMTPIQVGAKATGIPFFDEEWAVNYWAVNYWAPITRLLKEMSFVKESLNAILKLDWDGISSTCKSEILNVLGGLLTAGTETANGWKQLVTAELADEIVNTIFYALFGQENSRIATTPATSKATAKIALEAKLPESLIRFICIRMKSSNPNAPPQGTYPAQHDAIFFVGLILTTMLGELKPEVAAKYSESLISATRRVTPDWVAVLYQASNQIEYEIKNPGAGPRRGPEVDLIYLNNITAMLMCLGALTNGIIHSETTEFGLDVMKQNIKRYLKVAKTDAQTGKGFKYSCNEGYKAKLPLSKFQMERFAMMANLMGNFAPAVEQVSFERVAMAVPMFGMINALHTREEQKAAADALVEDQKRRGLRREDETPTVQDLTTSKMMEKKGIQCAVCGLEGQTNTNVKLMRCGGCKEVYYCSQWCQKSHWKLHKTACKAAQAKSKEQGAK